MLHHRPEMTSMTYELYVQSIRFKFIVVFVLLPSILFKSFSLILNVSYSLSLALENCSKELHENRKSIRCSFKLSLFHWNQSILLSYFAKSKKHETKNDTKAVNSFFWFVQSKIRIKNKSPVSCVSLCILILLLFILFSVVSKWRKHNFWFSEEGWTTCFII